MQLHRFGIKVLIYILTFLMFQSLLDKTQLAAVKDFAYKIKVSLLHQQYKQATAQFGELQTIIGNVS